MENRAEEDSLARVSSGKTRARHMIRVQRKGRSEWLGRITWVAGTDMVEQSFEELLLTARRISDSW